MVKKLMNKKRNNKGFSLVELIVVVLIIAIIAVALAPQVMKWVGESKKSVDANNASNIKAATNTAVAEYLSANNTITGVTYSVTASGLTPDATNPNLVTLIETALNNEYPLKQNGASTFSIIITSGGAVTVN